MNYTITANDEVGDEFLLRSLWRERREQEAQFKQLIGHAAIKDGGAEFWPHDYTRDFRRWLLNNAIARGYTVIEKQDMSEWTIKVRLTKSTP